ncbi:MAG: hypothetical protein H6901_06375 [Rhodobacteraceae bacterium]|nr:hypothetical protein [Paracoccaceae bacterium]MCP5341823.1 hypothetical protein [Paracoccaceae bacterium]
MSAGLGFAVLQAIAYAHAGVFEYPLDDVYIHLAMAEGIGRGTYGVNPGVPASASSSILWPLLLVPWPGTGVQRMLPLMLNFLALLGCGWAWGRSVMLGGFSGFVGVALAVFGPLALNMPGVAFTGMENSTHALVSLLIVLGLWRFLTQGTIGVWFAAALIVSPLIRLEGLALSLLVVAVMWMRGRGRAALPIGVAIVAPVAGFALFLTALGLDPLPGSVLAKMELVGHGLGPVAKAVATFWNNLQTLPGLLLAALTLTFGLLPVLSGRLRRAPAGVMLAVLSAAGLAHLLFARIGWMHRYEHYILVAQMAGLMLCAPAIGAAQPLGRRLVRRFAGLALIAAAVGYWPALFVNYLWNPRAIHLQQAQMARFVHDFFKAPVAVNDLGWVSWNNDRFVLDLWGLGSQEVRHIFFAPEPPPQGWADALVKEHDVRAALIYDSWFLPAIGPDWVRLGGLTMDGNWGVLGGWEVSFYATTAEAAPELREAMRAFAPTLPPDAHLSIDGAGS